jgi:hypothetical protein
MNGRRITNMGTPVNAQDAATKDYADSLRSFSTSLSITGADANGRLNFSSPSGANGISWTSINGAWIARPAVADQHNARVVLNNQADGSGTDVVRAHVNGMIATNYFMSLNTTYDGTTWRTVAPGYASALYMLSNVARFYGSDTATTAAFQAVTMRQYAQLYTSDGSARLDLNKSGTGKYAAFFGYSNNLPRWGVFLGSQAAETGSNTGSDFVIQRYADNGNPIGSSLTIFRNTGIVNLSSGLQAGYGIQDRAGSSGGYSTNWHNFNWVGGTGMQMWVNASMVGIVSVTCDYRIKKDVRPLPRTWNAVKQLRPISYTHKDYSQSGTQLSKDSDEQHWGFLAHELQETLLPSAATGEKDAENQLQSPDLMALVAALTSALQEAQVRIEALEAKLA